MKLKTISSATIDRRLAYQKNFHILTLNTSRREIITLFSLVPTKTGLISRNNCNTSLESKYNEVYGKIKDRQVAEVEYLINSRPRKRLGGLTPYEVFYQITGVALDS